MLLGSLLYLPMHNVLLASSFLGTQNHLNYFYSTYQYIEVIPLAIRGFLPDALWAFSFSSFLGITWGLQREVTLSSQSALYGGIAGSSYEIGQFFHLFPGTFDLIDLGASLIAGSLAIFIIAKIKRKTYG